MPNDMFENIDGMADETIQTIATRLEARAGMATFGAMRDQYFDAMNLADNACILELGGGTGIVGRAYARRPGFVGSYTVSDLSASFIEIAKGKCRDDGLEAVMDFCVADAMNGDGLDGKAFDAMIMHTLISHVPDPEAVLRTAARATRPGGIVVVFDGDYASMQINSGDEARDATVTEALQINGVAQPTIMRHIPRLARSLGLLRDAVYPHFLSEVGDSTFFIGLTEAIGGAAVAQGDLAEEVADTWIADLHKAIENDRFFGMCPYFTYLYRKS